MAVTNDLIPDFDDFERYFSGQMPAAEQRALEGRMLDEPLVAEAYEGFLAWRAAHTDAAGMRSDLHTRLQERTARASKRILPLWAYASAASVLLVLFAYWAVFLRDSEGLIQKNITIADRDNVTKSIQPSAKEPAKVHGTLSEAPPLVPATPSGAPLLSHSKPAGSAKVAEAGKSESVQIPDFTLKTDESAPAVAEAEIKQEQITVPLTDSGLAQTTHAPEPTNALVVPGTSQALAKSARARARPVPSKPSFASKKSEDTNGHSAPETLNEVVVTGSSFARKQTIATPLVELDRPAPVPADGWEAYRAHIDKNTDSSAVTGQVVVTFAVSESGALSGFMARGPAELQNKAIQIIRQGPAWLPARANGAPVNAITEMRLQFRR